MPTVQSAYSERIAAGFPGMVANEKTWDADTRICETVAGIGFGCAVSQGSGAQGAVLGGAVAGFVGVTVRDATLESGDSDKYQRYANMAVLTKGDIWVTTKNDVAVGGDVYYDSTTGLWDDAASGNVGPVKGAVFMTAASSGGLAIVRFTGAISNT